MKNKETGKKFDGGKPKMHLLPVKALYAVVKVLEFGAEKYGKFNWHGLLTENGKERVFDAIMRHWAEMQDGNMIDDESGLPHMAHIACNALFWLWFDMHKEPEMEEKQVDSVRVENVLEDETCKCVWTDEFVVGDKIRAIEPCNVPCTDVITLAGCVYRIQKVLEFGVRISGCFYGKAREYHIESYYVGKSDLSNFERAFSGEEDEPYTIDHDMTDDKLRVGDVFVNLCGGVRVITDLDPGAAFDNVTYCIVDGGDFEHAVDAFCSQHEVLIYRLGDTYA